MDADSTQALVVVQGPIKWFDPIKGFGFLADSAGGADVLIHANVLRNFGQSSVAEAAMVVVRAMSTARGRQATEVLSIQPPPSDAQAPIADLAMLPPH
ncbi:MAG: cold-shock protein, partial [Kocuria rhizophila]